MLKLIFLLLFFTISLAAEEEEILARRIYAHLIVKDELNALAESQKAIKFHPLSKILRHAHIQVLAHLGQEEKALKSFKEYVNLFPNDSLNRDLLESLSWGVINKGAKSPSPILRIFSLVAAHHGEDAKSVNLVHQALDDTNSVVRQVAVEVASTMRDAKLCDKMMAMLTKERDWNVRLGALEAVGKMKIRQAEKHLIGVVAQPSTSLEEKAAASQALLNLLDKVERGELLGLAHSSRSDLRKLCAMIIGHLGNKDHLDIVAKLLDDSQADVRKSALQALGSFPELPSLDAAFINRLNQLSSDNDPEVAIYAAWVFGKYNPNAIEELFKPWQDHSKQSVRIIASAALASLGSKAGTYLIQAFNEAKDPYVKINLGMALIKERIALEEGLDALYKGIEESKERWMIKEFTVFDGLSPSDVKHNHLMPNYPEVANQLVRLEMLNILAMMRHPLAKNAIQSFLRERSWGVTGLSASLLLTEGDEEAIAIVRNLVDDSNPKVRVQAALILALWGGDEKAIHALKEAYPSASREVKEQIIEGIGKIGLNECLPFLVDKLNEPFQSLRIIAASSILQCLYH